MKLALTLMLLLLSPGLSAAEAPPPELKLENLLRTNLEVADGVEVIVSRVTVPPNSQLPKHWHPGEEFGYVLEGKVSLWLEGKIVQTNTVGEAVKIPLGKVHTAVTGEEGATLLVFRVHPEGEPERVMVD